MAVTDYVSVTATQNTQTNEVTVTVKTLSGFADSIPKSYDDPQLGTGIFTGSVKFTVVVGSTNAVIGPTTANDGQTYTATLNPGGEYSSGQLIIQAEYSFPTPSPSPTPVSPEPAPNPTTESTSTS